MKLPVEYLDVTVLHTGDEVDLVNDFNLTDDIDNLTELVLPTGRTVRLTIRAVCEEKDDNKNYYGFINEGNKQLDNRYGESFQVMAYTPSSDETNLLSQTPGVPVLQGIFMQPDVITAFDGKLTTPESIRSGYVCPHLDVCGVAVTLWNATVLRDDIQCHMC